LDRGNGLDFLSILMVDDNTGSSYHLQYAD